jgi:dTDP-4-dehydrorhamnose reductase
MGRSIDWRRMADSAGNRTDRFLGRRVRGGILVARVVSLSRALILGASGQLGTELQRTVPSGIAITALDVQDVDIRDRDAVTRSIATIRPDTVINCAAFTNVDGAESARDEAMATNAAAAGIIAEASAGCGARLLHVSTDYVFDGNAGSPYRPDSATAPLNVYGESKLEGERRVLANGKGAVVIRTAWLHSGVGSNFVRTAVRLLGAGSSMKVVDDQIGTPTRARNLAQALWSLRSRPDAAGTLHFTDAGVASWYDVAVAVMETIRAANRLPDGTAVEAIASSDRSWIARRPSYSVLDKHHSWRVIGFVPPHWREGVIASTHELLNA